MRPQALLRLLQSVEVQTVCPNEILIIDGSTNSETEIVLKENTFGIKVLAGIWSVQKYLEDNTLLLVLSDGPYDEKEYIRDYNEFLQFNKK